MWRRIWGQKKIELFDVKLYVNTLVFLCIDILFNLWNSPTRSGYKYVHMLLHEDPKIKAVR